MTIRFGDFDKRWDSVGEATESADNKITMIKLRNQITQLEPWCGRPQSKLCPKKLKEAII